MRIAFVAVLLLSLVGLYAWADTPVTANQGKPGNQGPWPVTSTGSSTVIIFDGGLIGTVATQPCSATQEKNTSVGTTAVQPVPTGPLSGRVWIRVCNSLLNTGSTQCICAVSTCPASVAAASIGDVLNPGDCVTYNNATEDAGIPCCICNGAASRVNSTECKP